MGRLPIPQDPDLAPGRAMQAGVMIASRLPTEDPDEGCPGGWYRSRFVDSVLPFLRRRDGNGGRVQNLRLDRTDDDLVIDLVAYLEAEQERWEAYRAEASLGT